MVDTFGYYEPTVQLGTQRLIGTASETGGLDEFRSIPYATVHQRWTHSEVRTELPHDLFDARHHGYDFLRFELAVNKLTDHSPKCPQPSEPNNTHDYQSHLPFPTEIKESELECLNLFIVRPNSDLLPAGDVALPVLVWIHGGAYAFGSSTDPPWNPRNLIRVSVRQQRPIIVVSINYRLNAFGFLAGNEIINSQNPTAFLGCNFGLRDQYNALRWIHDNISAFGGNPSLITIAGQSAGGSSVHAQVLQQKLHAGPRLFQNAIIQSGAVGTLGPISWEEAQRNWEQLSEELGVPDGPDRLKSLRAITSADIILATKKLGFWVFPLVNDSFTISPAGGGFWSIDLSQSDTQSGLPSWVPLGVMIGDTDDEGSIWREEISRIKCFEQVQRAFLAAKAPDQVLAAYSLHPAAATSQLQECVRRFLTDLEFGLPVHRAREALSSARNTEGELRLFTRSYRFEMGNPWPGVNHGRAHHSVDLIYLFNAFSEAMNQAEATWKENPDLKNSCLAAVSSVQGFWLDFVCSARAEELPEYLATVWDQNRRMQSQNIATDEVWLQRRRCFEILAQDLGGMSAVRAALLKS